MNFIIDPINNDKIKIYSNRGKQLLKTYIKIYQTGGAESDSDMENNPFVGPNIKIDDKFVDSSENTEEFLEELHKKDIYGLMPVSPEPDNRLLVKFTSIQRNPWYKLNDDFNTFTEKEQTEILVNYLMWEWKTCEKKFLLEPEPEYDPRKGTHVSPPSIYKGDPDYIYILVVSYLKNTPYIFPEPYRDYQLPSGYSWHIDYIDGAFLKSPFEANR